jgi:glucose 1-dehydrogenase
LSTARVLQDQRAIVTGASSGIGAAIARAFAAAGAKVGVNYASSPDDAERVAAQAREGGAEAITLHADVSDERQVQAMFQRFAEAFGGVDIVVANAGIQIDNRFVDMEAAQWNRVLQVNLTGQFLCAREGVRRFLAQGPTQRSKALGKIICMSSVHEVIPWAGHVNYAASKGGVMLMMKSLAQEVAPRKIRVNSIAPGAIRTPINRPAWETDEAMRRLLELIPYGRIGEPEDVARAAVWLASDESDYVTGTTLFVDGGMCLYAGFADNG